MRNEVLLLNANAAPVSWLPLSAITWQNAVRLIWLDVVEVLHSYDGWTVHSPSTEMTVPSVLMLRKQVKGFRTWVAREESPQSHLIFLRDSFLCQYCLKQFPRNQLTVDHVIPKYYGGKTRYDNCTTACQPCNGRRGCDITVRPATAPFRPTLGQLVRNMRKFPISIPDMNWNHYLNWPEAQVQLVQPRSCNNLNDNFDFGIELKLECIT